MTNVVDPRTRAAANYSMRHSKGADNYGIHCTEQTLVPPFIHGGWPFCGSAASCPAWCPGATSRNPGVKLLCVIKDRKTGRSQIHSEYVTTQATWHLACWQVPHQPSSSRQAHTVRPHGLGPDPLHRQSAHTVRPRPWQWTHEAARLSLQAIPTPPDAGPPHTRRPAALCYRRSGSPPLTRQAACAGGWVLCLIERPAVHRRSDAAKGACRPTEKCEPWHSLLAIRKGAWHGCPQHCMPRHTVCLVATGCPRVPCTRPAQACATPPVPLAAGAPSLVHGVHQCASRCRPQHTIVPGSAPPTIPVITSAFQHLITLQSIRGEHSPTTTLPPFHLHSHTPLSPYSSQCSPLAATNANGSRTHAPFTAIRYLTFLRQPAITGSSTAAAAARPPPSAPPPR